MKSIRWHSIERIVSGRRDERGEVGRKIRNNESGMNTKVSVYGCQFSCIDVSVKGAIGAVDRRNE